MQLYRPNEIWNFITITDTLLLVFSVANINGSIYTWQNSNITIEDYSKILLNASLIDWLIE